jgi:hypothetical protein
LRNLGRTGGDACQLFGDGGCRLFSYTLNLGHGFRAGRTYTRFRRRQALMKLDFKGILSGDGLG